jgi:hypothetical protein
MPAAGMVARREAATRWPAGDEVDGLSNRGPRGDAGRGEEVAERTERWHGVRGGWR